MIAIHKLRFKLTPVFCKIIKLFTIWVGLYLGLVAAENDIHFSTSTKDCRTCVETKENKWCRPKYEHKYGKCVSTDMKIQTQYNLCSSLKDTDYHQDYLLCPSDANSCGTQIQWSDSHQDHYKFVSNTIPADGVCWYELKKTSSKNSQFYIDFKGSNTQYDAKVYVKDSNGTLAEIENSSDNFEVRYKSSILVLIASNSSSAVKVDISIKEKGYRESYILKHKLLIYIVLLSALIITLMLFLLSIILFKICKTTQKIQDDEEYSPKCIYKPSFTMDNSKVVAQSSIAPQSFREFNIERDNASSSYANFQKVYKITPYKPWLPAKISKV
ncbi:unnamed protein product [Moneuplotes crassus]|uniref:Uncharacterized protein n=1 Tax=Euplotes crassus TaxID=5936 RepID=A0AAD1USA5_EUPCR|nr:unnamed protein product [Moneuplotes crassus]